MISNRFYVYVHYRSDNDLPFYVGKGILMPETQRNNAKLPYPSFVNVVTGEIIPAGRGLKQLCRERKLNFSHMGEIKNGIRISHKGWKLAMIANK